MTEREKCIEKYRKLITEFVSGKISAIQFERNYLDTHQAETYMFDDHIYEALNTLFLDVDDYCANPTLRREGVDLNDDELLSCAKEALRKLDKL